MRILFTTSPGWGHVHPLVPLAQAFLERGDEILWGTGAESAGRLAAEGIPTACVGLDAQAAMAEFFRRHPEVHDVARLASGVALQEDAAVIAFGDAQARAIVVVRRAQGLALAVSRFADDGYF